MSKLIAIAGGIGSGKSVVSQILRQLSYPVYDSDTEARRIMDESDSLILSLVHEFGTEVVCRGKIDRRYLGSIVFNDKNKLLVLNGLVHRAVIDDLRGWYSNRGDGTAFVETAILYESGLDKYVDEVWEVVAPEQLRIARVIARSKGEMSENDAKSRIESQRPESNRTIHPHTNYIVNDNIIPVLPQVLGLLR